MDSSLFSSTPAPRGRAIRWLRGLCAIAPLSVAVAAYAVSEPSLVTGKKQSFAYSWEQEQKLGADSDKEITEQMGLYDNPELQTYVEAVGQRVLQQTQFNNPNAPEIYRNIKFTFRVIDSPVVNAFALPGGYVYVTRGLLSHVENEAQLAVVLGHEIGHVAARHSSQQARRSQWTQLGVIAGAILGQKVLGDKGGEIAPALINAGGQAAQMFLLRYSREAENEADTLGVGYAANAGYAAEQSAKFFESLQRLAAADGKNLPTWQSTHPDPGDRARHVIQLANAVPPQNRGNVGEGEYLRHIEGIVVGENPREGFAQNGVFYHPELRFQLPVAAGWKLDNQKAAVVMAEPNGKAMMGLKLAAGTRARDAAQQFAQQSKVQVTASGDTMINGLPTTVIIGQATTDQGAVGVWDAFIEMDGKVYSLLGYAPQAAFEQMRPTFESTAAGFSPLRDQSVASVQPAHLRMVRADRAAPFAAFVPTALPPGLNADAVAIMNQVTLNDQINEGRTLKVPDAAAVIPQVAAAPVNAPYPNDANYPARAGYPQNYPNQSARYPNDRRYPEQSRYPNPQAYPEQSRYPSQTYPQSGNPQNYPPQGSYPNQQGYPSSQQGYPQSQSYPPYPNQGQGAGPGQQYPQSGQQYPQSTYPGPQGNYPASGGYPQNYPQFPQSGGSPSQPAQPQQPTWPR
jgi:predicted Zn-dependent protease